MTDNMIRIKTMEKHPLENVVIDFIRTNKTFTDAVLLTNHLAFGVKTSVALKAYRLVAEDVLGCLVSRGKIVMTESPKVSEALFHIAPED